MPPKNKSKGKNAPAPKKAKGKKDDSEFVAFLEELNNVTKIAGESRKVENIMTQEEKRQKHLNDKGKGSKDLQAEIMQSIQERKQSLERQQKEMQLRQLIQSLMMRSPFALKPNKEFNFEKKASAKYEAACGWMQGWRSEMEDAHIVAPEFNKAKSAALFSVFDGHSGADCAKQCQTLVLSEARAKFNAEDGKVDFDSVYRTVDEKLRTSLKDDSGCTAVTVLITDDAVTCANVGDSRAILVRDGGIVVDLSHDHKPENPAERERIERLGGTVENNRTNGQLAMSRALGDFTYKKGPGTVDEQLVICVPEVITVPREPGDEYVILACDGIFDVMDNTQLGQFVRNAISEAPDAKLEDICQRVCLECLAPELSEGGPARAFGTDNMTITIVKLK